MVSPCCVSMMQSSYDDRLVFDLDDTLYLERDFALSGFRAVGAWLGRVDFASRCQELFDAGSRGDIFDRVLDEIGATVKATDLVQVYRDHHPQIRLCDDALRYLRSHSARFGLITDGPERMQRNKVAALGLEVFFDQIIPTGQWPGSFAKPHPRSFQLIAASAGRRRCVYVADNPMKDFFAPNQLGWTTVQIVRPWRVHHGEPRNLEYAAQHRIESLDQLDSLLRRLPR